ncbi:amidohydrolase family protein [Thermosporothrix hazakensis]|uniref:Amidohydrolase family protein n=2 Tax=Thermosporothrix hazakensis TaxID=644383 RepID=A0A326UGB4_THEHA|nr:amidohydrolase family protein [Thermosporothrix hazakensis]GCE46682.1 hydrolase [Thermosporothrix hazakensis]
MNGGTMLDLTDIPVIDNHCHSMLLHQHLDTVTYRSYFTEATAPVFAQQHVQHTVYYLWMVRHLARFLDCESTEEAVIAARQQISSDELVQRLLRAGNIKGLVLDGAYPPPEQCYSAEQLAALSGVRVVSLLRLEVLMQDLLQTCADFDEYLERYREAISNVREKGYCGFKSIVAYRAGLNIAEWSKEQARLAFQVARTEVAQRGSIQLRSKPLIDYLLHIAFASACEQRLPVQFHTGYGDSDTDMLLGNPLHLRPVLEAYQEMSVVLLHESYPYSQLGAYLAAIYPHVYFDLSYTIPFVEKLEMLAFTRQALSIAPASKLTYSSDGIYVPEMHWASALRGRAVLAQVLQEMIDADELDEQQAHDLAEFVLYKNAAQLYGV